MDRRVAAYEGDGSETALRAGGIAPSVILAQGTSVEARMRGGGQLEEDLDRRVEDSIRVHLRCRTSQTKVRRRGTVSGRWESIDWKGWSRSGGRAGDFIGESDPVE